MKLSMPFTTEFQKWYLYCRLRRVCRKIGQQIRDDCMPITKRWIEMTIVYISTDNNNKTSSFVFKFIYIVIICQ